MGRTCGFAVLVGPEEANVEIIAGILEVVRIATEEGRREFRSEDEAYVGVLLEGVEVVLSPLVERHHITTEASLVG